MAIDQVADEFMGVLVDACLVDACLLGVGHGEDRLINHTAAAVPPHSAPLVVDIGLRADESSPQRAVDFTVARVMFLGIRAAAVAPLGEAFDVTGLHDVLGPGSLPMRALDEVVQARAGGSGDAGRA